MADAQASRRRTRKSIAHLPSSTDANLQEQNKENEGSEGASSGANANAAAKKSRSKSLGPGGLDALQTTSGNRRKVIMILHLTSVQMNTYYFEV